MGSNIANEGKIKAPIQIFTIFRNEANPQQPPPYYQDRQRQGNPLMTDRQYTYDQSYYSGQGVAYQQRLDGQPVYVVVRGGPPPPQNVSRGGYSHRPGQPEENLNIYRDSMIFSSAFDTIKIRNRFVQKVYTILAMQLLFTFGFVFLAIYESNTGDFLYENYLPFAITGTVVFMIVYFAVACCETLRRTFPLNFILLSIITIAMTMVLMVLTVMVDTNVVLYAMGTTATLCILVSLFACQTRWDVTGCGMCLCIAGCVLMLYGFVIMILALVGIKYKILDIVYAALATLLFSFWLMYDTQQIVGGRRIELSPEEYILGALSLYVDIVQIFMNVLTLFQSCGRD